MSVVRENAKASIAPLIEYRNHSDFKFSIELVVKKPNEITLKSRLNDMRT